MYALFGGLFNPAFYVLLHPLLTLSSDTLPVGYGGLVFTTILLIIVGQIVLQTVLAIGQESTASAFG